MLSVLGLLLVGAGLCSAVFCGFAFGEVIEARQAVAFALKQAEVLQKAVPNSTLNFQGKPMNLAAWQELTREHRHTVLARGACVPPCDAEHRPDPRRHLGWAAGLGAAAGECLTAG
jgi:hypothetical protein